MKQLPDEKEQKKNSICWYSFWHLLMLDNPVRLYLQDPEKILDGYIRPGMTVLDIGCGPGNFTRAMRRMTGKDGKVIAIDLQEEMLRHAQKKCEQDIYGAPVTWHRCGADSLGIAAEADFALTFYMVHEVPDRERLCREIHSLLKPDAAWLLVEPVFHVTDADFSKTLDCATRAGFTIRDQPRHTMSRAAVLVRDDRAAAAGREMTMPASHADTKATVG